MHCGPFDLLPDSAQFDVILIEHLLAHGYRLAMVMASAVTLFLRLFQQWLGGGDELILLARHRDNGR